MDEKKNNFWDFVKFSVIAALVVIPIRLWIAQPFIVNGASMQPTFQNGDYLIVDEFSYLLQEPKKEEVIVFRYPRDPSKFFIKRVVGTPGETMTNDGKETVLGEDEYFVMGDNRDASSDSRRWGPVPKELIIGRAFIRLWPFNKIGAFPGY